MPRDKDEESNIMQVKAVLQMMVDECNHHDDLRSCYKACIFHPLCHGGNAIFHDIPADWPIEEILEEMK